MGREAGTHRLAYPLRVGLGTVQYNGHGVCLAALERAFTLGQPAIFNSDQGAQFTSHPFTQRLIKRGIKISMAGVADASISLSSVSGAVSRMVTMKRCQTCIVG